MGRQHRGTQAKVPATTTEVHKSQTRQTTADEMRAYKEAKKSLKNAITLKKNQGFQELRDDISVNLYRLGYKIVMDTLNKRKPMEIMDERVMRNIVDTLFPTHELTNE